MARLSIVCNRGSFELAQISVVEKGLKNSTEHPFGGVPDGRRVGLLSKDA